MFHSLAVFFSSIALVVSSWFGGSASTPAQAPATAPVTVGATENVNTSVTPPANSSTQSTIQVNVTTPAPPPSTSSASSAPTAQTSTLPTGHAWLTVLPLGDGDYTTSGAKKGYIYVCHVAQGGGGAQGSPTWISGSNWYPDEKVAVQGALVWPSASYSMKLSGSTRLITSNGLPTDHPTGLFPIQASDPAHAFDANPNSIEAQNYSFSLPAYPTATETPGCIFGQVGIMNDGVPLFDGFDAEYRDAVAHEVQDAWEGHPQESGMYHDHGFESLIKGKSVSTVLGFAYDGYPITGPELPNGNYLTTADLDQCHGLTSTVTLDGKQVSTYHYVLTQDFPYSVSCFHGTSYEPKPSGGGQGTSGGGMNMTTSTDASANGTPPAPPQEAISACTGKASGASCSVGPGTGTCTTIGTYFACKP
jgi:YHYH protein